MKKLTLDIFSIKLQKGGAKLLRKFTRQVERNAVESRLAQEFVKIVREPLKDETEMASEHEMSLQLHDMKFLGRTNVIKRMLIEYYFV